jgi:hypothetical protein
MKGLKSLFFCRKISHNKKKAQIGLFKGKKKKFFLQKINRNIKTELYVCINVIESINLILSVHQGQCETSIERVVDKGF